MLTNLTNSELVLGKLAGNLLAVANLVVAAVPITAGVVLELYVLAQKLAGSTFQTHVAAIIVGALAIMVGMQLLATGLVGEMISDRHATSHFKVRARHGFGEAPR